MAASTSRTWKDQAMSKTDTFTRLESPVLLKWQDYRHALTWRADSGANIGFSADVESETIKAHALVVPVGQSYRQARAAETVMIGVDGYLDVTVDGIHYGLEPNDLVFVPPDTAFSLQNAGLSAGFCFEIMSKMPSAENSGTGVTTQTTRMPWDDIKRQFHWDLPYADRWGCQRASGPFFLSKKLRGHMVRQPANQGCPWHAPSRDVVYVHLAGEDLWTAAGGEWLMEPRDLFVIPANTPYVYANHGSTDSIFFDIAGPAPESKGVIYWKSDPGWPVREDAELLPTVYAPDGQARLDAR
jgi:mannose-6-phosphate isomerase-like protein (cupin superfamily)